ncbi:hypothetical protein [Metabacillus halosaccharovorans]|uniref:Uncharacterized protein n=1 Tax=Metabacillus halosaccharovorans TaxID=930124 RepID=A0ABT3DCG1_9BACI|nr:hypothetical protein [Metabacillus halosaccharovorans]MCV9884666.1 hypothetical protein [Metabacillus halosaccharovorans]
METAYKSLIISHIERMGRIFESSIKKLNPKEEFNQIIDLFLAINKTLEKYDDGKELINGKVNTEYSDLLVDTLEAYNNNQVELINQSLINTKRYFNIWGDNLKRKLKYKVIVFGMSNITLLTEKIVDPLKADIIYYVDETGKNTGRYLNNIKIIEFKDLSDILLKPFDYFINMSANNNIAKKIQGYKLLKNRFIDYIFYKKLIVSNAEFYVKHVDFVLQEKKYTGLLTGLSYVQKGIDEKHLKGDFFNLAYPGQDLFYDFEMFKYAFQFREIQENLQHVIIGLSYFSFHYDLSLSTNEFKVHYYYPVVKTMHNNKKKKEYQIIHDQLIEFQEKLFYEHHFIESFKSEKAYYDELIHNSHIQQYNCQMRTKEEILEDISSVKQDYNKNYPLTCIENKKILNDYLSFLTKNHIKPIIVVCPTSKLYQAFTPISFRDEFYEIIGDFRSEYDFQFLDYYFSNEFDDADFYDISHIGLKGSQKFAKILNRDIEW